MSPPAPASSLVRALGRRDLTALMVNAMVGSGMMAAPAKVFALAHGWSLGVLAASALLILPVFLCFAELGARFSGTGGPYLYARAALPGWLAFCAGWSLWISQCFSTAALSNLLLAYLAGLFPVLAEPLPRALTLLGFAGAISSVVLLGIQGSARGNALIVATKMAFVVGFVTIGLCFVHPSRLVVGGAPSGVLPLAQALLLFVFAYTGFEKGGVLAGEARDPRRDVPWALFASLVIATLAYAGVLVVCLGVLGDPGRTERPLAEVGRLLFGGSGALAVSAGAITVIVGVILVAVITGPRLLLAMSEEGHLPAALGRLHPRWRTPYLAVLLNSVASFGFAFGGDLLKAVTFSTAARVVCYILCCAALVRLSQRPDDGRRGFRLPAPAFFAATTAAMLVVVLVMGAAKELPILLGAVAAGLVIYGLTGRARGFPRLAASATVRARRPHSQATAGSSSAASGKDQ